MSVTIKDVAKKANVSISTVSLVINNHPKISKSTRKQVLKTIEELNYHPSRQARGLVSKKTGNLGFIITEDHFSRAEPFYTKVFLGTEFESRDLEYYILLTTVPPQFHEDSQLPRFILEKNVDGVILAGKIPRSLIDRLKFYKMTLVFVDYYLPDKNFPVVLIDNISGGYKATMHLIESNHRKIAFIGGDIEHPSIVERFQGYKLALEKSGIPFDPLLTVTDEPYLSPANGYQAAKKLFEQTDDITAIFASNDAMAFGVLQFLKEHGKQVPDDISLIGFDDVDADLTLEPPLTTISVPKIELGVEAIRLMIEKLQNPTATSRKVLVPVDLVVRGSTKMLTIPYAKIG